MKHFCFLTSVDDRSKQKSSTWKHLLLEAQLAAANETLVYWRRRNKTLSGRSVDPSWKKSYTASMGASEAPGIGRRRNHITLVPGVWLFNMAPPTRCESLAISFKWYAKIEYDVDLVTNPWQWITVGSWKTTRNSSAASASSAKASRRLLDKDSRSPFSFR